MLEDFPVVLGVLIGAFGVLMIADAYYPDYTVYPRERRRSPRMERDRRGEALIGLALLFMAAALIGRDRWRFGTVAVILGTIAFVAGVYLNIAFLKELLTRRGAARRHPAGEPPAKRKSGSAPTDSR